ncbi:TRAP transporter substrate-binding protein [Marispirochaeta sp.]|uniref:TRAP transporter substrate-binding protein n=1 Tax=Marispirochaeta sp. TaxID=2038653 RepID=UPI0029C61082|nr:TRAP transporter substrate-binding protein [Marispirochaeta sp.]
MKKIAVACLVMVLVTLAYGSGQEEGEVIKLRYAHMNSPESVAGKQAVYFAEMVKEKTGGEIIVEVYPSSQLGTIQEQAEMVSNGTVAFHHNTMAGIGSLYPDYAVLDTPFLYKSVDHLMRVTDVNSPVMKKLNDGAIAERNIRNIYNFFFGARQLTTNKAVYTPADLKGMKIRAIPFPIYMTAVEGMGAIATPIDWSEVPTALATGAADGQENPVGVIYANKLFDIQSHMMVTSHIMGAECVVMNEAVWKSLTESQKKAVMEAAEETAEWATAKTIESEQADIEKLKEVGMTVITADNGLQIDAFRESVTALVRERFDDKYGDLYSIIDTIK